MSNYKLYYFPGKGRAEPARLIFAYKEIKYEDIRLAGEKWTEFKPKTPFGVMPVLEEDGRMLGGSLAIARYLAEKFDVAGSNAWENAQLGSITGFIDDFANEVYKVHFEKDEAKKKELQAKMTAEVVPKYLGKLNELAGDNGYLFGERLTWPDLVFFCLFEGIVQHFPELGDTYPNLAKLMTNVKSNPNIAKWLAERPDTPF